MADLIGANLTVFAGGSGAGKSLFLQNLGVNWSQAGLNTVYLSLELSEQLPICVLMLWLVNMPPEML